jgi:hypothetical protein
MKTGTLKVRAIDSRVEAEELETKLVAQAGVRVATVHPGDPAAAEVEYDEGRTSLEQLVGTLRGEGLDVEIAGSAGGAP